MVAMGSGFPGHKLDGFIESLTNGPYSLMLLALNQGALGLCHCGTWG